MTEPEHELKELQGIYMSRGLSKDLALQVATELTAHDALGAHARDELGISEIVSAKPVQAAFTSAATFAVGAALPLIVVMLSSPSQIIILVSVLSLVFLTLLGGLAAKAGGASLWKGGLRVTFWGALAMAVTALVGHYFGVMTA